MAGKVSITAVELTLNLLTGPPGSHGSVPRSKAFGVERIMTPVNFRVLEVSVTEVAEGGEGIGYHQGGVQCARVLFPGVLEYLRYLTRIGDEGYNTHPLPALGVD